MKEKPDWLKKKLNADRSKLSEIKVMLRSLRLHTVCEEARCPNMGECFASRTATFMILGNICTRNCRFCAVSKGIPGSPDPKEPENISHAVHLLQLRHAVITSVTRDDLNDGGASQFVDVVRELRKNCPNTTIELLIPDLNGNWKALERIVREHPDVLNHNIETVPSLYANVRPGATYERSIGLLRRVKEIDSSIITKSGIMVGLGEREDEVKSVIKDLSDAGCRMLTIGQYLQPSHKHLPVVEYITPEQFEGYRIFALERGFSFVASGPLVRSSYHAALGFSSLR
ncbi:radical SAM protein [Mesotoga sp. HF07.pep.5.2.highcov]|uniref:Lipoyl synthase n=1 Tax=Mesotoga prima MesG1.Ag.4.2 TaxID=660470 RepID=I2F863_9BACT|nr:MULTISPECIES: lipoyl synthase [Mesotoga]MDK2944978.1 lipoyl synthase [Mesotoga sp.]AFK08116.1 lipoate synthase [Mesotoga prima MesG1.Ag.4.2]PIJ61371.1 radical SAM protein [Mesotoga sp. H07.pep.5.3]RLL82437.1 radical SAM protein [Mesotoga sp. H07pep.5.4]RLL91795.1 radical SAM protein [Mesotoga sp. HF07.pep.5.2.highcov]